MQESSFINFACLLSILSSLVKGDLRATNYPSIRQRGNPPGGKLSLHLIIESEIIRCFIPCIGCRVYTSVTSIKYRCAR
ncbi:hypothetical protein F4782DRAFT_513004 [Xylaria castorea]|nr:hypothetical protein F4782DRAFT_513004 [Xylaria castorea]